MKKIYLLGLIPLMISCGSSKQVASSSKDSDDLDAQIEYLEKKQRLAQLQHDVEMQELRNDAEKKNLLDQVAVQEKLERGVEMRMIFCVDESYDKPGEYIAGLGISQGELEQKDALLNANRAAIAEISSRFMGVVKNAVSDYAKNTNTSNRNAVKESQLEGLAISVGEKAVNKFAERVCTKIGQEKTGAYRAYVAVHVPIQKTMDEIQKEMDVLKVDYDREIFMKKMQEMLDADAAKRNQELENLYNSK